MVNRETEINGMTFRTYDADEDPSGMIGHALADAYVRENGWRNHDVGEKVADKKDSRARHERAYRFIVDCAEIDSRPLKSLDSKRARVLKHIPKIADRIKDCTDPQIGNLYRDVMRDAQRCKHPNYQGKSRFF